MLDFFKKNYLLLLIIFIASLVFLTNLSGQDFSLDEPETIFLSRTIKLFGVPSAWDGGNLFSYANGLDVTKIKDIYVWNWHPWLQHYITFFQIVFFGDNIFSTRFPFALLGVFTVIIVFLITYEIFDKKWLSFLVSIHLIFLLPFFLYVRQVRYYSPTAFFSLVIFFFCIKLLKNEWKRSYSMIFLTSGILLFLSNYVVWGSTMFLFLILSLIKKERPLIFLIFFQLLVSIGWFAIIRPLNGSILLHYSGLLGVVNTFIKNYSYIHWFIFPSILLVLISFFQLRNNSFFFNVVIIWIFIKIIIYSIFLSPHGRYLVDLLPFFPILLGFLYNEFSKLKIGKYLITLLFLLVITSNILSFIIPVNVSSHKKNLLFFPRELYIELMSKYPSVFEELGRYLNRNYQNGDLFWSNEYRLNIYYYSKVPTISPICDIHSNKFIGPDSVINPDKVRWVIFFQHDDRLVKNLAKKPCFGKIWEEKLSKDYTQTVFPGGNMYFKNDPDIVNREFPPRRVYADEIIIYERKIK